MPGQNEQLDSVPAVETEGWGNYQHFADPTRLPFNTLVYPSQNCLIPSKDKVVPRPGKTKLGQEFTSVEGGIAFDATAQGQAGPIDLEGQKITGDVFDNHENDSNASIKIDDTHVLTFWHGQSGNGKVQAFEIDPSDGTVTPKGSALEFDADNDFYNSPQQIDATHFINFWTGGASLHGFAQVFTVNLVTYAVTAEGTALEFDASVSTYNSSSSLGDGNHFVNFWKSVGGSGGQAQVFEVDLMTWAVTLPDSPVTFDAVNAYNSCASLDDGEHFINFWQGTGTINFAQAFEVNISTFAITALSSPLTFSTVGSSENACVSMGDGEHFFNTYSDDDQSGHGKVFNVNLSTFVVTVVGGEILFTGSSDFSAPSISAIPGAPGYYAVFYTAASFQGQGTIIQATTAGAFPFSLEAPVDFGGATGDIGANSVTAYDDTHLVVFYRGPSGNTGRTATFEVLVGADSLTFAHTCSGDDRMLFVTIETNLDEAPDKVATITYAGVNMTLGQKIALDTDHEVYLYYLIAPSVGTHNVFISTSDTVTVMRGISASYTGAKQEAPTGFSATGPVTDTNIETAISVSVNQSWVVSAFAGVSEGIPTLSPGLNIDIKNGFFDDICFGDSDDPESIGIFNLGVTSNISATLIGIGAAFAPAATGVVTKNWSTIGHKKRYSTDGGYLVEVRVVKTDSDALVDRIDVLLPNLDSDIVALGELQWYQITENNNPLPASVNERVFMDQFFDTNLDPSISRRNSRLVWTNGNKAAYSWSGGIAPIVTVVPDTSISTTPGVSWRSLGFIPASEGGSDKITVRGTAYDVASGWDSDTLLLSSTGNIFPADYAFAYISAATGSLDVVPIDSKLGNIDFCRQNKNYMFYGSWNTRQYLMSNNFNKPPVVELVNSQAALDDLIISPLSSQFNRLGFWTIRISIKSTDHFSAHLEGPHTSINLPNVLITGSDQELDDTGIFIQFLETTGHTVGDFWELTAVQAVGGADDNPPAWANFWYNLPRAPGEGYIFPLAANFWSMEPQEDDMYVNDQYGNWAYVESTLAADLMSETINFQPLKQVSASKMIYPYMISHFDNYLIFVTESHTLDIIGRQQFLELPQMTYLSEPVTFDFNDASFQYGSMEYLNKELYITSPLDNKMFVFDNKAAHNYWQPPQTYTENGILSIVGDSLISHSNLRDNTFTLFDGPDDDGAQFTVIIRTAYTALPRKGSNGRWDSKFTSNSFVEGYVVGNPPLFYTVFRGVNDPTGLSHAVKPVVANVPPDTAPLAQGFLSSHSLASDPHIEGSYFQEIFRKFKPVINYYFTALQITCTSRSHTYSILSLGVNAAISPSGNNTLIGDRTIL